MGTLLVVCLGGFAIQVCVPRAIHLPFSFQRKEIEMNEKKGGSKERKKKRREREKEKEIEKL